MSHTHTLKITTDNPVDEKGVQAFIDACGYLLTGYLGENAVIEATWNQGNEPATPEQVAEFDVRPTDNEFDTVAAMAGKSNTIDELFADLLGGEGI